MLFTEIIVRVELRHFCSGIAISFDEEAIADGSDVEAGRAKTRHPPRRTRQEVERGQVWLLGIIEEYGLNL